MCSPRSTRKINTTGRAQSSEQNMEHYQVKGEQVVRVCCWSQLRLKSGYPGSTEGRTVPGTSLKTTRRRHSPAWYIYRKGTQHIVLKSV